MSGPPPDGRGGMRLFVAVWPAPALVEALAGLPRPALPGLRWTTPEQWHVTLRFLGWVADSTASRDAFAAIRATAPALAVAGPRLGRFGHRVLHLPVHGLETLAADVVAATAAVGRPPDDRPFSGHITLARAGGHGRPDVDLAPFTHVELSATWPVGEVTLVRSVPAGGGVRYEVVDRRPVPPVEGP